MVIIEPLSEILLHIMGILAAGFIFMFGITLLTVAAYLAIMIGRDLYDVYFKAEIEKLRRKNGPGKD